MHAYASDTSFPLNESYDHCQQITTVTALKTSDTPARAEHKLNSDKCIFSNSGLINSAIFKFTHSSYSDSDSYGGDIVCKKRSCDGLITTEYTPENELALSSNHKTKVSSFISRHKRKLLRQHLINKNLMNSCETEQYISKWIESIANVTESQ